MRTSSGYSLCICANTGAILAQPGHWKSLYSINVTAASSGPSTQSSGPTGGKSETSVGPGVGLGLIAVQPGGLVGCAVSSLVGVDVSWIAPAGLACVAVETATGVCAGALLLQAASAKMIRIEIFFMGCNCIP